MGSIKQNYANNVLTNGKFDATDLDGVIPNTNINDNSIDNVTVFGTAGSGIASVASDPPSPTTGDTWYNTTSNSLKYSKTTTDADGTFVSGGNLNLGRQLSQFGSNTAGLGFGGYDGAPNTEITNTESYDGTSWTEVNDLNIGRYSIASFGVQTAGIGAAGYRSPPTPTPHQTALTESWNGTSWSEVNDLNSAGRDGGGAGTQTAGLFVSGVRSAALSNSVESWDGTSWTEIAEVTTSRTGRATGIQTAAIFFGGEEPALSTKNELWNGTSWTEVGDLNTATGGQFASGISTRALSTGGNVPPGSTRSNKNEAWDGTSWTEVNNLTTARAGSGGMSGTTTSGALIAGGNSGGVTYVATTEEFSLTPQVTKTVTTA